MESSRGRWRWGGRCVLTVVVALCFVVAVSLCCSGCREGTVVLRSDLWRRPPAPCANQVLPRRRKASAQQWRRRLLSTEGPGSYPPRCTSKCGSCSPCYPVHVAVPPGVPVTTEYYPEAWRCRCGSRLYMP
uniref:Uncharacterized protein n=1 Tax=Avena sativa TaxID=4498 RepID=A0ACD5WH61_AVESA